ncbi:uncharacterized protein LOC115881070 isoform X2 [Sitophilus oryzae]|uniref:Uncharacterized protein LOC115881070 isoform X2 n=1 Tax=Sitophilus oryzae TaxID=7048 RepID=A0A6J2XS55_SITOR|nr:uncharacterized protein LOC115881070 isoform X2 [Sitophilus oryzae]
MAKFLMNVVVISFTILIPTFSKANLCQNVSPCVCIFNQTAQINIDSLIAKNGFIDDSTELQQNTTTYYFHGCTDGDFKNPYNSQSNFTASLIRCDTFVTPINKAKDSLFNGTCEAIGKANEIRYALVEGQSNHYKIVYDNQKINSLPSIQLVCVDSQDTSLKISNHGANELLLYSPAVCVKYSTLPEGLSFGTIFCLIFFISSIIYFVGGGLILYFARGARGIEVIPNYDFWTSLPGLIKDGTIYILGGCRPFTVSTAETYDRI